MRILALTDIHGRKHLFTDLKKAITIYEPIDLVVIAGDLTHFENFEKAIDILKRLIEEINKTILFIPGNCDDPKLLNTYGFKNNGSIYNIHSKTYTYDDYVFYGIGGSNETPFSTWIEWSEEKLSKFLDKPRSIDVDRLIMVTHTPIYGIMDEISGLHVGSRVLREFLEEHGAKLWITGHLHEYSGYVKVSNTLVVNPGPFMRGYYATIDLDDNDIRVEISNIYRFT